MTYKIYKIDHDSGEVLTVHPPMEGLLSSDVYLFKDDTNKKIYIWLGHRIKVRERFVAATQAHEIRNSSGFVYRIESIDQFEESPLFLQFLGENGILPNIESQKPQESVKPLEEAPNKENFPLDVYLPSTIPSDVKKVAPKPAPPFSSLVSSTPVISGTRPLDTTPRPTLVSPAMKPSMNSSGSSAGSLLTPEKKTEPKRTTISVVNPSHSFDESSQQKNMMQEMGLIHEEIVEIKKQMELFAAEISTLRKEAQTDRQTLQTVLASSSIKPISSSSPTKTISSPSTKSKSIKSTSSSTSVKPISSSPRIDQSQVMAIALNMIIDAFEQIKKKKSKTNIIENLSNELLAGTNASGFTLTLAEAKIIIQKILDDFQVNGFLILQGAYYVKGDKWSKDDILAVFHS